MEKKTKEQLIEEIVNQVAQETPDWSYWDSHQFDNALTEEGEYVTVNDFFEALQKVANKVYEQYDQQTAELREELELMKQAYKEVQSSNTDLIVKNKTIQRCAEDLSKSIETISEWNKKYPPGRIYDYGRGKDIENELTSAINNCLQALINFKTLKNGE